MKRALVTFCAFLLSLPGSLAASGRTERISLHWSELGPYVTGHKVALVVPGGTSVEGKVREVNADGLRLRVSKTSDRKVLGKGEQVIPRQSVSVLHVTSYRALARVLCAVGGAAAAGIAVGAQDIDTYEGPLVVIVPAVTAAGIVGAGVGGYFIGKRIDKRVTEIRILPDAR